MMYIFRILYLLFKKRLMHLTVFLKLQRSKLSSELTSCKDQIKELREKVKLKHKNDVFSFCMDRMKFIDFRPETEPPL